MEEYTERGVHSNVRCVSNLSVTCAVIRARGIHGWFCWVIDNAPDSLAVLLVVDHLSPGVDIPDAHTPFIVAGG